MDGRPGSPVVAGGYSPQIPDGVYVDWGYYIPLHDVSTEKGSVVAMCVGQAPIDTSQAALTRAL